MASKSQQFRMTSFTLFAAGIAVLLLSVSLTHSFETPAFPGAVKPASEQLLFLLPILLGTLLTFVAGIRISLFAKPWSLVIGGILLFFSARVAPAVVSAAPRMKDRAWNSSSLLLMFMLLRILGLIFSTTGALRLLRTQSPQE